MAIESSLSNLKLRGGPFWTPANFGFESLLRALEPKKELGITEKTDLSAQLFRVLRSSRGVNRSPPISGYLTGFVKTTVRGYPRWANLGASAILLLAFSRTPAMANPGGGLDFP